MEDKNCKHHNDPNCKECPKYVLIVHAFPLKTIELEFWCGQNADIEWGAAGMEDWVEVRFLGGKV